MNIAEKYRAESVSDLIISQRILDDIRNWLKLWNEGTPTKKGLILYGPPGSGKTTTALALAKESGVPLIEMNASETRNSDAMKRVAMMGSQYSDLTLMADHAAGFNKIILIDEADNIFEGRSRETGGDSGGITELARVIRNTRNPIILTMNDFYGFRRKNAAKEIINNCLAIEFRQFRKKNDLDFRSFRHKLTERLIFIAQSEGLQFRPEIVDSLIERNRDDLRAIINDAVSMMAYRDDPEAAGQPSIRDAPSGIYDVMHATFKEGDYEGILRDLMDKDFTTEDYLMWLDKNLPMEAKDAADLDHAYDILSIADVFVGRVIKKQHYAYKGYAEEIAAGVSTGIVHRNEKYVKYEFPSYIMKMSRLRDSREGRKFGTAKLARFTHSGRMRISGNLWFYGEMLKRKEFSAMLEKQLNLSEKELSVLKKG